MEQMDLVIEILLKLPVKSILRFKCVCKSWRSLIESPLFIDLHYKKSNMSNRYVLLNQFKKGNKGEFSGQADLYLSTRVLSYDTLGYVDVRSFSPSFPLRLDARGYTKFDFSDFWIKGVCNGLLLVNYGGVYHRDHYALWNLGTGETKVIPTCLCARGLLGHAVSVEIVGFGFDVQSKDYKVVMINKLNDSPYHHIVVEVYSLRTDSWRTAAIIPNSSAEVNFEETGLLWNGNWNSNGVFSNGMYSCLANVKPVRSPGEGDDEERWYHEIYSFDMSKEVITTTPLPRCIRECAMCINTPLIFNGSFALSSSFTPAYYDDSLQNFDIWVLGEYGVEESWSKVSTVGPFYNIYRVLGFWKDNKVLGASSNGNPFLIDPDTEFTTSVESPGHDTKLFFYKESLVRLS